LFFFLEEKELLRLTNPENIRVDANYRGPRQLFYKINKLDNFIYFIGIEGPITRKVFVNLIEAFQRRQVSGKCSKNFKENNHKHP
jgi:hypothetical protein